MSALLGSSPGGVGVFPTLPDSAPGYAYPVVGATLVLLALIYYAAKRIKPPDATPAPQPAPPTAPAAAPAPPVAAPTAAAAAAQDDEVDTSFQVLQDVIKRLSRTQTELAGCRSHAEHSEARNQRLIANLKSTQAQLRDAREQLARYADHARPLHADRWRDPRRPQPAPPSPPASAPPLAPLPEPDDDPTDPIPGPRR